MTTDFQARIAAEVLWQESRVLRNSFYVEGYQDGRPSAPRLLISNILGPKSEDALGTAWSEAKAKKTYLDYNYEPMRKALEAAAVAATWEEENRDFQQTLRVVAAPGAHEVGENFNQHYVEATIDKRGRRKLIGPFWGREKAEECIKKYGWERLQPDIAEFARELSA